MPCYLRLGMESKFEGRDIKHVPAVVLSAHGHESP